MWDTMAQKMRTCFRFCVRVCGAPEKMERWSLTGRREAFLDGPSTQARALSMQRFQFTRSSLNLPLTIGHRLWFNAGY